MTLPVNYNTGTVTGHYTLLDGTPVAGTVNFSVDTTRIVDGSELLVILPYPHIVTLDATGAFSVVLPATDDPDINPLNFTYRVIEQFHGGAEYSIAVPAGVTTDISTVVAVAADTGIVSIIGPQGVAGTGASYTHNQSSASAVWTINHNLGYKPNLQSFDSSGTEVDGGTINHVSINQCTITWSVAIGGLTYAS